MIVIKILIVIIAIVALIFITAPWVVFLIDEYTDWADEVIYKIREKKYENKNED